MNGEFDVVRCLFQLGGGILTGVLIILALTDLARKCAERRDE